MRDYSRIAARVFNTPLLVTPEAAATVADVLAERMGVASLAEPVRVRARADRLTSDDGGDDAPYTIDGDGLANIAVHGELVNRGSWMDAYSGVTSYKSLQTALAAAESDYRVRGIVLDIDSPGGEAAGAMETAAAVRATSAKKKVVAYVDSLSASAAYAIASGAAEIVATPSATLGSIGVVYLHLDRSQAMKDRGVKPTLLHAGAFKVDGNSMQPLPDEARARIQTQIDEVYGLFVETVGAHRPALGVLGARRTEAGMFLGARAVEAGLADRVGGRESLKTAFPSRSFQGFRSKKMADEPIYTQAAQDSALAAARSAAEAATVTAVAAARTAERERIKAILNSEPAKGRGTLARHLALSSDMAPEAALAVLGAAALEVAPEAPKSRMDRVPTVDIRPGSTQRDDNPQAAADDMWKGIVGKLNSTLPAGARRN